MHLIHKMFSRLDRFRRGAPLVLRAVVGGLFLWHGVDKFDAGIPMVESMFRSWGVPLAGVTAPAAAVVEIVAGTALIVGLLTRAAGIALAVVMLGSLAFVKADLGVISSGSMPGAELDLTLLAALVAVIVTGPGMLSLDDRLGVEPTSA